MSSESLATGIAAVGALGLWGSRALGPTSRDEPKWRREAPWAGVTLVEEIDCNVRDLPWGDDAKCLKAPVGYTPVPLFSESGAHFVRPASRTCSSGELSSAATGQEVLLARAVAVETAEEAAVDARRS